MMKQKMLTRSFSKVFTLIVLYNQTVAAFDVTLDVIGSVDNSPTLACGKNVIFMCSSTPVTDEMDWFMDNTNIATCKFGLCAAQVTIPANALFEYNVAEGIYNITFTPILESNGAREYKCEFGSDFRSLTPTVTVFPDNSNSGITNSTSSNDINITASTCVSSSDLVSFKWYIFKTGESRKLFGTVPTNRMNESSCQSTTNCNGEKSTSTVTIKNLGEENGEYYYFQVEIIYDYSSDAEPNKVTINSPTHYKISVNSDITDDGNALTREEIIFIAVGCVARVYAIQTVILIYFSSSLKGQSITAPCSTGLAFSFFSSIPVFGFIPLLVAIKYYSPKTGQIFNVNLIEVISFLAALIFGSVTTATLLIQDVLKRNKKAVFVMFLLQDFVFFAYEVSAVTIIRDHNSYFNRITTALVIQRVLYWVLIMVAYFVVLKVCDCNGVTSIHCHCCHRLKIEEAPAGNQTKPIPEKKPNAPVNNRGILMKHQHIAGKDEICCDYCESHASYAYCLSDELYLCKKCLKDCKTECVRLWIYVDRIDRNYRLCCNTHYNLNDLMLEGVCIDCNKFICAKCMKGHKKKKRTCTRHRQIHERWSEDYRNTLNELETVSDGTSIISKPQERWSEDYRNTLNELGLSNETKTCSSCGSQPIECLNVHSNIIVCADCFEKGKQPAKGRLNVNDIKNKLFKGQNCQIHEVLGNGRPLPVAAFCFVCNLHMCVECFKKHRRIYDYWSKSLKGNLFYCSCCKDDKRFPVVCFDMTSGGFKCTKCFLTNEPFSETYSLPDHVTKTMNLIIARAEQFQCHKELSNDGKDVCSRKVYCLVCKLIMCRNCFSKHQQNKVTLSTS